MSLDRQFNYRLRRIDEHQDFKKQCSDLIKNHNRFDEILLEIRRDLQGYAHDNPNCLNGFYWKETAAIFGMPSFVYTYTFDDNCVTLLDIQISDE